MDLLSPTNIRHIKQELHSFSIFGLPAFSGYSEKLYKDQVKCTLSENKIEIRDLGTIYMQESKKLKYMTGIKPKTRRV